jgi:chaperonin GroES
MDEDDLPEGEMQPLDDAEDGVEDTEDGGAIVRLDDEDDEPEGESDHYANLAEELLEPDLSKLATTFLDLISKDKEARKRRDEQYEEGLRRTGLGDDAPGGAQFQGASKVVHPMLTEACIDFAARAMKELFPPEGPAKDYVPGKATAAKMRKAKRKTTLLNWQMTVQAPELRAELEQLMTQVPLGGAQYLKVSWDSKRNRPGFLFVPIDDMYLPYAATNFYTAQRRTHVQYLTQLDYEQRVKSGMYRDVELTPAGLEPEMSVAGQANDKIEGRDAQSYNEDGLRIVYEIYTYAEIEDDVDGAAPYIISIDKPSGKVLSIYRNWDEDDTTLEEQQWFVEFPFIPWRGAYPIGLPHMIGGLSGAATGALRALLDAAHISNSQTMLKLKGGTSGGQSLEIQPTQVVEIEGGLNVDDVRKLAMPLPYNQPSPVLFSLLGFLVEAGKGVVRTSMEDIADGNPNAPVGTTLAKIEQGMTVFSSIHGRLHDAMARMLRILHRLNAMYLSDEALEHEAGEELASREDFEGPLDVVPVSDPNIFSEAQRYAQIQAVAQRAQALPQLYDLRKVEERLLATLKIPNAKDLLNPAEAPSEQNAVNENVTASLGRPVTAFPEQDHIAHLQTHLAYMTNPMFGANQLIAPAYLPVILNHIKEHLVMWYAATVFDMATEATGRDIGEMLREIAESEEAEEGEMKALDRMLAAASMAALQGSQQVQLFQQLPPVIQQAQQMLEQMQPQMQQDPKLALEGQKLQQQAQIAQQKMQVDGQKLQMQAQTEQQKLQMQAQNMQANAQTEQAKLQLQAQGMQVDAQMDQAEMQMRLRHEAERLAFEREKQDREDARKAAELQARISMNTSDNATAMELAAAEIASGERIGLETGTGINPNPMER